MVQLLTGSDMEILFCAGLSVQAWFSLAMQAELKSAYFTVKPPRCKHKVQNFSFSCACACVTSENQAYIWLLTVFFFFLHNAM